MTKKLAMDLDDLKVESFDTFVAEQDRGTVRANAGCYTYSCAGTCGAPPPTDSTLTAANPWAAITTVRSPCCV